MGTLFSKTPKKECKCDWVCPDWCYDHNDGDGYVAFASAPLASTDFSLTDEIASLTTDTTPHIPAVDQPMPQFSPITRPTAHPTTAIARRDMSKAEDGYVVLGFILYALLGLVVVATIVGGIGACVRSARRRSAKREQLKEVREPAGYLGGPAMMAELPKYEV